MEIKTITALTEIPFDDFGDDKRFGGIVFDAFGTLITPPKQDPYRSLRMTKYPGPLKVAKPFSEWSSHEKSPNWSLVQEQLLVYSDAQVALQICGVVTLGRSSLA
jgi:hypothetical protein